MTQKEQIIEYLEQHKTMTPIDAFYEIGCMKLATRVSELKRQGYDIETKMETYTNWKGQKKRYARYVLNGC